MLEHCVTRLERERMYNNIKAIQGIPTLVARSLDSDDEVYFLCEFPNTLKSLKDVLIDLLLNEDYDESWEAYNIMIEEEIFYHVYDFDEKDELHLEVLKESEGKFFVV